ncbi:MAG: ketol-acid reductoisomerase [Gemmatimonadota bacterium]
MSDATIYTESDAPSSIPGVSRIAVVGYGSQGEAHARNLDDAGFDVVVGLREGSPSRAKAASHGLAVATVAEAVKGAELVSMLIPDPAQPRVFEAEVKPNLAPDAALLFAHGFNVHFGAIEAPEGVDVILVAPKSPGPMLRREFENGNGVPALFAVHRDVTGEARERALAYGRGLGSARAGMLETTFAEETETDLFGEQAVLCGGVSELVQAGFDTLVDAGYQPEVAYFECLHELKLIVDLMYQFGVTGMRERVSDTAEFGDYVSGPRVVGQASRQAMKDILAEIQGGDFARRWMEVANGGSTEFQELRDSAQAHLIEEVGPRLRGRMAWMHGSQK